MDEYPTAAWPREVAAPIGHPEDLDMGSTIAAPARPSTSWLTVALGIGLVVALSVAVSVSFGLGQGIADETGTIVRSHPVAGYPVHYGFAGPSRVGPNAGSRIGYLPHYGLAGPSWVGPTTAPIAAAAGYPLHDGLAGPSQVDKRR